MLVRVARSAGLVDEPVYNATLAASLITILLNAVLMRLAPGWVRPRGTDLDDANAGLQEMHGHVVICGFGRIGSLLGTALDTFSLPYLAIETDPDIVKALRFRGVPCMFGNAAHLSILERAHLDRASLVVSTIPDSGPASAAVQNARRLNAAVPIIARAHRATDREQLLSSGATQVIEPEIEASAVLVSSSLRYLPLSKSSADVYVDALRAGLDNATAGPPNTDFPVVSEIVVGDFEGEGQTIAEARIRERFGVTVVTVSGADRGILVNPPATTTIRRGNKLRIFGLPNQIEKFAAYVRGRAAETRS